MYNPVKISVLSSVLFFSLSTTGAAQCLQGECVNGKGSFRYESGSRYIGEFKNGEKHGAGVFIWLDGREYAGEFVNDMAHGAGVLTLPDGRKKTVRFDHGKAVSFRWQAQERYWDGCRFGAYSDHHDYFGWYRGGAKEGYVPHGRGRMKYQNGSVYEGEWDSGKMHGNGTIRWDDGSVYTGEWRSGKRSGFGIYRWSDGKVYIGSWFENSMQGAGVMKYSDGSEVGGIWKDGMCIVNK